MTYFSLIDLFNKRMAERKEVGFDFGFRKKDKHVILIIMGTPYLFHNTNSGRSRGSHLHLSLKKL